jgi:hypothetical protein
MLGSTKKLNYKHMFDKKQPKDGEKGKDEGSGSEHGDGRQEDGQNLDDGDDGFFVSDEKRDMEMLQQ